MAVPAIAAMLAVIWLNAAVYAKWHNNSERDEIRHIDVVVEKGETVNDDILTDKSVTVNGILDGDCASLGGPVTVNGDVRGDVMSAGGPVAISGVVDGDVASMGGAIEISGTVTGDVASMGGNIILKDSASVAGDVSSFGGKVEKGNSVILKGEINSIDLKQMKKIVSGLLKLKSGREKFFKGLEPLLIGGLVGLGILFVVSLFATGLILFILPPVFFPKNVKSAAAEITDNFWKSAFIGGLILIALFPAMLLMLVSIMGIPLIPLVLMLFFAATVLGLSAFAIVLQKRFFEGIKKPGPKSLAGQAAVGYLLTAGFVLFGKIIPILGGVLALVGFILLAFGIVLGLGAVWSTKMGTIISQKPAGTNNPAV